jgi:hypothetical protein
MRIINNYLLIILTLLSLLSSAQAGYVSITASPGATSAPDGSQYIAISMYDAANSGVSFSAGAGPDYGYITGWYWDFPNGDPANATVQNPGKVTFSTAAYGLVNGCTVGVDHTGSSNESCAVSASVVSTVNVNVVQPSLEFNTTSWSSNDTAIDVEERGYSMTFPCGTETFATEGLDTRVEIPYEYKYTIAAPDNSGAVKEQMSIHETCTVVYTLYSNGTIVDGPVPYTYLLRVRIDVAPMTE